MEVSQEKFLDKGVQKLTGCLSGLSGETVETVIKRPQRFRLNFLSAIAELENDPGEEFIKNLENGGEIGCETDLGNCTEVKTKQRVYGEQRSFLGNYKTILGKAEALQKVIDKDLEEGLVSGPFALAELYS